MSEARKFTPSAFYSDGGWWAAVTVQGGCRPYWKGSRFTQFGAEIAASRMARKLNRLEAKGMVR